LATHKKLKKNTFDEAINYNFQYTTTYHLPLTTMNVKNNYSGYPKLMFRQLLVKIPIDFATGRISGDMIDLTSEKIQFTFGGIVYQLIQVGFEPQTKFIIVMAQYDYSDYCLVLDQKNRLFKAKGCDHCRLILKDIPSNPETLCKTCLQIQIEQNRRILTYGNQEGPVDNKILYDENFPPLN
jgi:hypothetical protein